MQRRPGLLAELLQADIPSRQAQTLLRETSHCVVCGITDCHQLKSEKIFEKWCEKLWLNYLRAHGLDPDLCLSPPENMSRRSWRVGLLNARIEHDTQLALLAGSSASDSETESEDQNDVSSDNDDDDGDSDDDDDDGSGDDSSRDDSSDDGDNADDTASDGTDSDLVVLTPRSSSPNSEHDDDLASIASSRPSHHQNVNARSSRVNNDQNLSASSSSYSTVNRTTEQAGPSVVSVTRSSKCAIQKSSTRLQVYRDPLPPPKPHKQQHQASAVPSGSTTGRPTDTRRALDTLDRNIDTGSQHRTSKPPSGPPHPRRDTLTRETGSTKQSGVTAAQQRTGGDDREPVAGRAETIQQRVIDSFEGLGNYDNTIRQQKRRPCSTCRGCGYLVIDDGPLATEEDILQILSQFDVTEQEKDSTSSDASTSLLTKNGFRIYNPQLTRTENMKSILNTIVQHSGPRNRAPGYIYAFTRPSRPGFLKIGYTNAIHHHPNHPYPDPVDFRLARWASACGHPVVEAFRAYMPCAAERMESLIHQTLREYRRVEDPGCRPCQRRGRGGGAHDEWFEVDVEVAHRVVSSWALFSAQRPYDFFGRPVGFWAGKVERERQRAREVLDVGEWLKRLPRYIEEMMRLDFSSIIGSTGSLIS